MKNRFNRSIYPFVDKLSDKILGDSDICLVGFYGDKQTVSSALGKFFGEKSEYLPDKSGLFLVHCSQSNKVALAVSSGISPDFEKESETNFFISVLLKLCKTVVPCISQYSVQNWYHSEKASFHSSYLKRFKHISIDKRSNLSLSIKEVSIIEPKEKNLKSLNFYSKTSLYQLEDLKNHSENSDQFKSLTLNFVKNFNSMENVSKPFYEFLDKIDKMVYCEPETIQKLQENLEHLVLIQKTSVNDTMETMCKNLKKELFEEPSNLSESREIKNVSIIENFQEALLKSHNLPNEKAIIGMFKEKVLNNLNTIEKEHALSLLNEGLRISFEKISKINNECRDSARRNLKMLKKNLLMTSFKILKYSIGGSSQELSLKPEFQYIISSSIDLGELKNVVELDESSILCLFENSKELSSSLFVYYAFGDSLHCCLSGTNYEVAAGSKKDMIVLTNNSTQTISIYSQKNSEIVLSFEKKVSAYMNYPHFLRKSNKVLFINERKQLLYFDIYDKASEKFFDLSAFAINTSCFNKDFLSISVSDNEDLIAIQMKCSIMILNQELQLKSQINLDESKVKKFFILNIENFNLLVVVQKGSISFFKIQVIEGGSRNYFCNKIIDVIEESVNSCYLPQNLACTQIYSYIQDGYTLDTIKNYYSILNKSKKLFKYKGNLPNEMQDLSSNYSIVSLKMALLQFSNVKLARSLSFSPYFITSQNIEGILSMNKNIPAILCLKNHFNFHFFEDEVGKLDSVVVVGIVGYSEEINTQILQTIFSVYSLPLVKGEITMYFSQNLGVNFVFIVATLQNFDFNASLLNTFEFISAVSDKIIVNLQHKDLDKAHLVITQLLFSRFRINEKTFYNYSLDLLVCNTQEFAKISDINNYLKEIPMKIFVSLLSPINSVAYPAESLIYLKKLTKTPSKYSGRRFFIVLKTVLAQVFIGDCHSITYWDEFGEGSLESKRDICQNNGEGNRTICQKNGICDYIVKYNENYFQIESVSLDSNHRGKELCENLCEFCDSYCELEYGHMGYHSLKRHENLKGNRCDVVFFNEFINNSRNKDQWMAAQQKKWHNKLWETPYESIYGLV